MTSKKIKKILYTRADLRAKGLKKSNVTLLRWEDAGRFPQRTYAGGTTVVWSADEIDIWFRDLLVSRTLRRHHQPRR